MLRLAKIISRTTFFTITASILFFSTRGSAAGSTIYVDKNISPASCANYSAASRSCASGSERAYKTFAAASTATVQGDLVLVRDGTFTTNFAPTVSGIAGNPITWRVYSGEAVTISGGNLDPAIQISNRQYLVIDGFTVSNVGSWLEGNSAQNNILQNNLFNGPVGAFTASSFLDAHYNKFLDNTFANSEGDSLTMFRSDYNLIEGNTFINAEHSLFSMKCGDFNVIRNNNFSNAIQKAMEVFDCDINEPGIPVNQLNSTKHNLIENNVYSLTATDDGDGPYAGIQYAGQNGLIRKNIFYNTQGFGMDFTVYSGEALNNRSNRFYGNVLYNNTGGFHSSSGTTQQFSDNVIKNNILYKNKPLAIPWNDNMPGGSQMDNDAAAGFSFEKNDVFNNASGDQTIQINFTNNSLSQAQATYSNIYQNNLAADPAFVNAAGHDFHLMAGSPVVDQGAFLTTATSAGSGTSMSVADPGYFYDGYGISGEVGDTIQLSGQTQTARITSIDYANKIISLNSSLTWTNGQGISLPYAGSAPDIGAYEFASGGNDTTPPAAPSGLTVQ